MRISRNKVYAKENPNILAVGEKYILPQKIKNKNYVASSNSNKSSSGGEKGILGIVKQFFFFDPGKNSGSNWGQIFPQIFISYSSPTVL